MTPQDFIAKWGSPGGRTGYADIFMRGVFAWENKAPGKNLDAAVAAAYGWADYTPAMPDEEILKRLLALNLARSAPSP